MPDAANTTLPPEIRQLIDKDHIRDCLYRYVRAVDRIDRDLLASTLHADAWIDYGKLFQGGKEEFLNVSMAVQHKQVHCQHLIGNILIELDGDIAHVESYEIGRHKTPLGDTVADMVLASRLLDRFERRDGIWAISHRKKIMDWGRFLNADPAIHDNPPIETGARSAADPSYALFDGKLFV